MRLLLCLAVLLCTLAVSVSAAHYKKILHTDVNSDAQIQVRQTERQTDRGRGRAAEALTVRRHPSLISMRNFLTRLHVCVCVVTVLLLSLLRI